MGNATVVEATHKSCTKCGFRKPSTEFFRYARSFDGRDSRCKQCKKKYQNKAPMEKARQKWRDNNPEKHHQANRNSWLKRNYGITNEQYDTMVKAQGGVCSICETDKPGGNRIYWCVDHNHSTGEVRGLLCNPCNVGLGYFRENKELLMRAFAYLKHHDGDDS